MFFKSSKLPLPDRLLKVIPRGQKDLLVARCERLRANELHHCRVPLFPAEYAGHAGITIGIIVLLRHSGMLMRSFQRILMEHSTFPDASTCAIMEAFQSLPSL